MGVVLHHPSGDTAAVDHEDGQFRARTRSLRKHLAEADGAVEGRGHVQRRDAPAFRRVSWAGFVEAPVHERNIYFAYFFTDPDTMIDRDRAQEGTQEGRLARTRWSAEENVSVYT